MDSWPLAGRVADCELIARRDGGTWRRLFPDQAFLECGPEGSFDRVLAFPSHNPPGRIQDKLCFFYTRAGAKTNPEQGIPMAMGLATIGRDRFAGLAHWRNIPPGIVVTKPFKLPESQLAINIEYVEHTPMRLAVTNADGSSIPGYSAEDSEVTVDPGRLYSWARWRDKPDLTKLVGKDVVLRFEVQDAVLYGYRFAAAPSD